MVHEISINAYLDDYLISLIRKITKNFVAKWKGHLMKLADFYLGGKRIILIVHF